MKRIIYLIGDAIVDNFYWLAQPQRDLTAELTDRGYQVHNYAADGMRVCNIFVGCSIEAKYQSARAYPYPVESDGKLRPIHLLSRMSQSNGHFQSNYHNHFANLLDRPASGMIVLSLGGMDIHDNSVKICLGRDYFMSTILTPTFINHYDRAIQACLKSCPKVVLVSVYLPYLGTGSRYGNFAGFARSIIEPWSDFIRRKAQQYDVAVLDLSNVFDCMNRSHYAEDETKASNIGCQLMARALDYIYTHYEGGKVYTMQEGNMRAS